MIRKQLYLEEAQDQALKARAKELGVSEAEFVRRALDAALYPSGGASSARHQALDQLLKNARQRSQTHPFPESYTFDREELYEEREKRWLSRS